MTKRKVTDEQEFADALKDNADYIHVEGDLADLTLKVKATGNIAWAVAIAAIGLAVAAFYMTVGTGGTAAPGTAALAATSVPVALGILGFGATTLIITLMIKAGSLKMAKDIIQSLRNNYVVVEKEKGSVLLKRAK